MEKKFGKTIREVLADLKVEPLKLAETMEVHPSYVYQLTHRDGVTCNTVSRLASAIWKLYGPKKARLFVDRLADLVYDRAQAEVEA